VAFKTLHDLLRWHGHTCKIKTLTLISYRERKWKTKNNNMYKDNFKIAFYKKKILKYMIN
jgi:hypothetical protein